MTNVESKDGYVTTAKPAFIEDGEVVVASHKFLLDNLDCILGWLFQASAGCVASIALFDFPANTKKMLFLIEDANFWERERSPEPARLIKEATGVEGSEVHFVPPLFITRTSSGKINRRKTFDDWLACQSEVRIPPASSGKDIARELLELFPGIPIERPLGKELSPIGRSFVEVFCEEHGIEYTRDLTLERIAKSKGNEEKPSQTEVFSIVALVDGSRLGFGGPQYFIEDSFLEAISEVVGLPVHFEQICVPPSPILFSDLIFHDYFLSRNPDPVYGAVASLLRKIKEASLILVDDEDNFRTPPFGAYPVLDHQFKMHPDAELLGHRTQRYTQNHHLLPRFCILGRDIRPECINPTLKNMESYLDTPILKMAFHPAYGAYTGNWDFCCYRSFVSDAEKTTNPNWVKPFRDVLLDFVRQRAGKFRTSFGRPGNRSRLVDLPHFCSILMNRSAVDFVTFKYNSFCIVGFPSSLPYLQRRLDKLGKPYVFASKLTPAHDDCECIILTGGTGKTPDTNKPVFDFMHAREEGDGGGRPHNVSAEIDALCPPLAACNEQLFRAVREKQGVLIGNYLLNHTTTGTGAAAPTPYD